MATYEFGYKRGGRNASLDVLAYWPITEPRNGLCPYQKTRVAALRAAREVLSAKNAFGTSTPDVVDLVSLASWIMDGKDPWAVAK